MSSKPPWHYSTIRRLTNYQSSKNRSIILQDQVEELGPTLTPVYSSQPHGSGVSDPTGKLGDRTMNKVTELTDILQELRSIDLAISMLNDIRQMLINLKYIEGNTDKYTNYVLKKKFGIRSRDTYYRVKDDAILDLAKMLGEWKEKE